MINFRKTKLILKRCCYNKSNKFSIKTSKLQDSRYTNILFLNTHAMKCYDYEYLMHKSCTDSSNYLCCNRSYVAIKRQFY